MLTYYIIEKDGKQIFKNGCIACFADITGNDLEFWRDSVRLTFLCDNTLSVEQIEKFLKKVSEFGVKGTFIERKILGNNSKNSKSVYFDMLDYPNSKVAKFSLHVLRCLIEDPSLVKAYVRHRKPANIDNFQFLRIIATLYRGRHDYFGGLFGKHFKGKNFYRTNPPFPDLKKAFEAASFYSVTDSVCRSMMILTEDIMEGTPANKIKFLSERTK